MQQHLVFPVLNSLTQTILHFAPALQCQKLLGGRELRRSSYAILAHAAPWPARQTSEMCANSIDKKSINLKITINLRL